MILIQATILVLSAVLLSTSATVSAQDTDRVTALTENTNEVSTIEQALKRPERLTVIAPKHLRPLSDYFVLVTLANSESPVTVDLLITGARDSNREQVEAKSVLVSSGETQTVKFAVGDWQPAEYILSVNALAVDRSWNFTQETDLVYQPKRLSVLIQTDKAIYKPGQLVQFRAIFLTQTLTPVVLKEAINITISDPKRNIIKQWTAMSNYRGLISLDLQLSDDPMLGEWTIKVETMEQSAIKKFAIAEYILPTFDVSILLPSFITHNDSNIVAKVKAAYTYGKPVRGQVALTVQPLVRFFNLDTQPLQQAQYKAKLKNGVAEISLDIVKDLKLGDDLFEREIEFFALVEEELTGRKYNKTMVRTIYDKNIKMELINKSTFKPGLKHLVQIKVAYQDDTPVEDSGPQLELEYSFDYGENWRSVMLRPVGGIASTFIIAPRQMERNSTESQTRSNHPVWTPGFLLEPVYTPSLRLRAKYRGQSHYLEPILTSESKSRHHIQISLPEIEVAKRPKHISVDDQLLIRVEATEPMQQVTCQGIAKGNMVWALNKEPKNATSFEFQIKLELRMAPEVKILCFYVRPEDKELIADSVSVSINGLIKNGVRVKTSRLEAKPGQEVELEVLTKPNALVGILGVDQSVLLLKSGNDISQADIDAEIKSYGNSEFEWSLANADSTQRIIDASGMVILTNNLVYSTPSFIAYRNGGVALPEASSGRIVLTSEPVEFAAPVLNSARVKQESLVIRSLFPETWIWYNGTTGSDGSLSIKSRVPDSITSWTLSAFSISESAGFGLSDGKTSLRVFRPFFIKLNLPYSIIRGETLAVQAIIFNYSKRPVSAKVTLENTLKEFEFLEPANNIEDERSQASESQSQTIRIPSEDGASVSFLITPRRLGHIEIKVTALSELAGDGVIRTLLVKPEGQTQYFNKAIMLSLPTSDGQQLERNFSLEVPANAVPGSQRVSVSASGDLMGSGLSNVDDLLRLPYGCGEQNMINLVPNIVILNYLQNTRRIRDAQRARALRNIETGYQRELNYKRSDGSFSAFGDRDSNGSLWLTAYVLKTFQQATSVIKVDPKVIRMAANFIGSHSRTDGSIEEVGMLHNKLLQSGANSASNYLTAYSMIALLQRPIPAESNALDEVTDRGLGYLERQLESLTDKPGDTYDLAIITYALQLANRQGSAERAYNQLWSKARQERDLTWWQDSRPDKLEAESEKETLVSTSVPPLKPITVTRQQSAHLRLPDSLAVEMSALTLMSTVKRGELERALPIVRWLIEQQNSNGGFASTQDTVLAIEALAMFAEASATSKAPVNIALDIVYPRSNLLKSSIRGDLSDSLLIRESNALVSQHLKLPDNTSWVVLKANGQGTGVAQVSWQYNLLVSAEQPAFYLNPIADKSSNVNYLQLSVCTFYKAGDETNMALMEVELPSGYVADVEALPGLVQTKGIKRVDTAEGDTKVLVYIDKLTRDELCLTVPAHRTAKVSNNKPVPVVIYDYYNRHQAARIFYEPPLANSCEICETSNCCSQKPPKKSDKLVSLHEQRRLLANTSFGSSNKKSMQLRGPTMSATSPHSRPFNIIMTALTVTVTLIFKHCSVINRLY